LLLMSIFLRHFSPRNKHGMGLSEMVGLGWELRRAWRIQDAMIGEDNCKTVICNSRPGPLCPPFSH
jgi:hypothetical protein